MDGITGSGPLSERWDQVGAGETVELTAVQLWMIELPFAREVATSRGVHRHRPLVMVQMTGEAGGRPVEGWGECAALADTTYEPEDAAISFGLLEDKLVPELFDLVATRDGLLPPPSALGPIAAANPEAPLAFAALEMAVADGHLRAEGRSLAGLLGVEGHTVALGAVVGQAVSTSDLVRQVGTLVDAGFTRLKMKIGPGSDIQLLLAVTRAFPELLVQADANGSYGRADADLLAGFDRFGLLCLEQPYDRADLDGHAQLAARMDTPICLDEGVGSPAQLAHALAVGACSVVCVKPGRLGGLGAALQVIDSCTESGVLLWMGGMFESGYARGVNTTLAALPGFCWPGDLSPARTYLGDDLVPGLECVRTGDTGTLRSRLPQGVGLGQPPALATLERYAIRQKVMTLE